VIEVDSKKFTMIDENFICDVCKNEVKALGYTARDHCNHCLSSKHVDINPGDRKSTCKGILVPIAVEKSSKDKLKIVYKCDKCGEIKRNVVAVDDDFDKILEIMKNKA
jgi:DNA-directed RNA polymerase subunit RPC12/RpoP